MSRSRQRQHKRQRISCRQQCVSCPKQQVKGIVIPSELNILLILAVIVWQLLSTDLVANMATVIAVIQQWTSLMF